MLIISAVQELILFLCVLSFVKAEKQIINTYDVINKMEINMNQNEADIESWYQKRWWTTTLAIAQTSLLFFEYSAFQISGLYYFKNDFSLENPKLFYSTCMGIIFLSGLISFILSARYIEETGDLRSVLIITLALNGIGNMMYTWTYSPYFALFGRFLAGANMGIQRAVSGMCMVIC